MFAAGPELERCFVDLDLGACFLIKGASRSEQRYDEPPVKIGFRKKRSGHL